MAEEIAESRINLGSLSDDADSAVEIGEKEIRCD